MLKLWWIGKIVIWNLKRRITGSTWTSNSPLPTWDSLLGSNCLVVFPTHFNLNNSLLIKTASDFSPIQAKPRLNTYPLESVIQPSNDRGLLVFSTQNSVYFRFLSTVFQKLKVNMLIVTYLYNDTHWFVFSCGFWWFTRVKTKSRKRPNNTLIQG